MIKVEHLEFITADTKCHVLKGIDLAIGKGERVGIIGASGSGKTTLGYHLCGIHKSALMGNSKGSLKLAGIECIDRDLPGFSGVILQNPDSQLFCDTVREEIALALENGGKPQEEVQQAVARIIDYFNLTAYSDHNTATLSHGLKQRVSIASMLALEPKVLLLDEPTNYLDNNAADMLFRILNTFQEKNGMTVIIIEHDIKRLACWAERIIEINDGRVTAEYTSAGLLPLLTDVSMDGTGAQNTIPPLREHGLMLDNVCFQYDKKGTGVHSLSLAFREGEITAVIGDNGSGKTTLLKLCKGLLSPTSGSIRVRRSRTQMDAVALVLQNPDEQLFAFSVEEECGYVLKNQSVILEERRERVRCALQEMGINETKDRLPFTLSYGEKRRLTLASVLVGNPEIICLDEPTVALDRKNLEHLRQTLKKMAKEGVTVIFSTHDSDFATAVATRIITMKEGRVVSDEHR